MKKHDVVVVGAGPYGLAATAQLRRSGADVRTFGAPMSFWMTHMPKGMLLRSPWGASHIGDRSAVPTLDDFQRARGARIARPVPLDDFVAYGRWVQERTASDIDPRRVRAVEPTGDGLDLVLEDGETIATRRVVLAVGISDFAWRPPEFEAVAPDLASHSSDHADLARFTGRRVAVLGAGQSALESAVLLHEAGADVELLIRAPRIRWVGRATRDGVLGRILFDRTDVGPAVISHFVARPRLYRRLSASVQDTMARRSLVAGAATWLRERLRPVRMTLGRRVTDARAADGALRLAFDDGSTRVVDHALLATGYRVDLSRYGFLPAAVRGAIRTSAGYPILDDAFQSSVPGLHFIGATAVGSFGPLVRFVSGTRFTALALAQGITSGQAALATPARVTEEGTAAR